MLQRRIEHIFVLATPPKPSSVCIIASLDRSSFVAGIPRYDLKRPARGLLQLRGQVSWATTLSAQQRACKQLLIGARAAAMFRRAAPCPPSAPALRRVQAPPPALAPVRIAALPRAHLPCAMPKLESTMMRLSLQTRWFSTEAKSDAPEAPTAAQATASTPCVSHQKKKTPCCKHDHVSDLLSFPSQYVILLVIYLLNCFVLATGQSRRQPRLSKNQGGINTLTTRLMAYQRSAPTPSVSERRRILFVSLQRNCLFILTDVCVFFLQARDEQHRLRKYQSAA